MLWGTKCHDTRTIALLCQALHCSRYEYIQCTFGTVHTVDHEANPLGICTVGLFEDHTSCTNAVGGFGRMLLQSISKCDGWIVYDPKSEPAKLRTLVQLLSRPQWDGNW